MVRALDLSRSRVRFPFNFMTNVLLEHKSLPIVSHTRAIKFCNELGFSSRMKITDFTSIFKFKVFYFIFKNLNVQMVSSFILF